MEHSGNIFECEAAAKCPVDRLVSGDCTFPGKKAAVPKAGGTSGENGTTGAGSPKECVL